MKRPAIPRRVLGRGIVIVVLLALHPLLVRSAAEQNVAAAILSTGSHTPVGPLVLAGAMMLVRLLTILCIPGIILETIGAVLLERWVACSWAGPGIDSGGVNGDGLDSP